LVQGADGDELGSNVVKISFHVVFEVVRIGDPNRFLTSLTVVLYDNSGCNPAFAHSGSISDKKSSSRSIR
jgi:hypothetical protein